MPLLQIIIVLVVVGVILLLINNYIPMDATIKRILNIVVVIVVILWLLRVFGVLTNFPGISCGQVKKMRGMKGVKKRLIFFSREPETENKRNNIQQHKGEYYESNCKKKLR